jgi:hypothetical protein
MSFRKVAQSLSVATDNSKCFLVQIQNPRRKSFKINFDRYITEKFQRIFLRFNRDVTFFSRRLWLTMDFESIQGAEGLVLESDSENSFQD